MKAVFEIEVVVLSGEALDVNALTEIMRKFVMTLQSSPKCGAVKLSKKVLP